MTKKEKALRAQYPKMFEQMDKEAQEQPKGDNPEMGKKIAEEQLSRRVELLEQYPTMAAQEEQKAAANELAGRKLKGEKLARVDELRAMYPNSYRQMHAAEEGLATDELSAEWSMAVAEMEDERAEQLRVMYPAMHAAEEFAE